MGSGGTTATGLPPLPSWETTPDDLPAAIREVKAALRARIRAATGRTVDAVVADLEASLRAEVDQLVAARERGEAVWPVLAYDDIAAGRVSDEQLDALRRRGCLVVRGHFPRAQAEQWDRDIVAYVESNDFFEQYRGPGDDFFGSVGSKPEIYPVYWSPAQMQARQSERMATVQSFLNQRWTSSSQGTRWFDPDRDTMYPDRIRRRPAGADSEGLGAHLDPGTLDLWMTSGYQRAFAALYRGDVAAHDPWDAAHRTDAAQYPGSTMCSAFRTFQGWTALSEMRNDQGVLHTVPIPELFGYLLLRPLCSDVPDDEMCGVWTNQAFPVTHEWHDWLFEGLTPIPDVAPGDSVWWHCDMVHAVAPVTDQRGWGNVMYVPAAPWCAKNERYAASVREALAAGTSPADFPAEDYEATWPNRFGVDDLDEVGRAALGLVP